MPGDVRLAEAIHEVGLEVLKRPNFPPTYEGRRGATSNIDVTLKSAHALLRVENWKVWWGMTLSDHNLITFTIGYDGEPPQDRVNGIVKYNWRKADWHRLRGNLVVPDWPMDRVVDVDKAVEDLTVAIQTAATGAVPLAHTGKTLRAPWNLELQRLRCKCRRARRYDQRSIGDHMCEAMLAQYRQAKAVFKRTLHTVRTESWQTCVRDSQATDPCSTPYNIAASKVWSPTVLSTLRKIDGTHTRDWQETAELFMSTLLPDDSSEDEEEHGNLRRQLNEVYADKTPVAPFTECEVTVALEKYLSGEPWNSSEKRAGRPHDPDMTPEASSNDSDADSWVGDD
ncbi:uncharacterized protein LOC126209935 [Schistocerca nitens]|uniref:uncharacterized protein LOC126209935 n=1 Tax=Schistocerca nitens TaxID=7011 RepID=UPI0021191AAC|nr:uncharacterized protein LOC126209935 [Schistocerca nitens]